MLLKVGYLIKLFATGWCLMTESARIWEKWKNKTYSNLTTYSLMKQPEFLQQIAQKAFLETMIVRIRRLTGYRTFRHTVDLGCATGEWSCKYADFSDKVTGVDINRSFIEEAAKRNSLCLKSEKISFVESNLIDFDNYSQVDLVCSGAALMYIDDGQIDELLSKIYKNIDKGSWIYIRVSIKAAFHSRKDNDGGFYRTKSYYKDLFQEKGFEIMDVASSSHVVFHELLREWCKVLKISFIEKVFFKISAFFIILKQILFGGNDYLNWILKKK